MYFFMTDYGVLNHTNQDLSTKGVFIELHYYKVDGIFLLIICITSNSFSTERNHLSHTIPEFDPKS